MVLHGNTAWLEDVALPGLPEKLKWNGKPDSILFVGYPRIFSKIEGYEDEDGDRQKRIVPVMNTSLEKQFDLLTLFYSVEHHCFACVRKDVYTNWNEVMTSAN